MPKLNIVGINFSHIEVTNINLTSNASILGSDIVIWRQAGCLASHLNGLTRETDGSYAMATPKYINIASYYDPRWSEFQQHLSAGKLLVIIPSANLNLSTNTGISHSFSFNHFLPADIEIDFTPRTGNNITSATSNELFKNLTELLSKNGSYNGTFQPIGKNISLTKISTIKDHPTQTIAGYVKALGGHVLYLCDVEPIANSSFVKELIHLYGELNSIKKIDALPDYSTRIFFKTELSRLSTIQEKQTEIEKINIEIEVLRKKNEVYDQYRTLIGGTGESLRLAVSNIFKNLQFTVSDVDTRKEDLVITYGNHLAAVEVKGKSKSAGSQDRRQLADWVSNYAVKHNIDPKGILIVNGFNQLELDKRVDPVFPNEMLEGAIRGEYCLISTIELLSEYLAVQHGKQTTQTFVDKLFATNGCFNSIYSLTDFVTITNAV